MTDHSSEYLDSLADVLDEAAEKAADDREIVSATTSDDSEIVQAAADAVRRVAPGTSRQQATDVKNALRRALGLGPKVG